LIEEFLKAPLWGLYYFQYLSMIFRVAVLDAIFNFMLRTQSFIVLNLRYGTSALHYKIKSFSLLFKMKQNSSLENSLNIISLDQTSIKHTSQVKYLGLWL